MARFADDTLIVRGEQRSDASWLFTIRYLVVFDQCEIGLHFSDSVRVSRDHEGAPVAFVACGSSVLRKKRVVIDDDAFGTLGGCDAIDAVVCLRREDGEEQVQSARLRRISAQSAGTRPRGPGTVSSSGRLSGGVSSGPRQ